jgi:ribosomal protein L11 methyltransferase
MCLEALEKLMKTTSGSLLDVGTGSGILAIYGAKLGAQDVKAIDIDPEALRWAKHNFELNDLSGQIALSSETLDQVKGPFSLLTANLILGEIIKRFSHFPRLLSAGGCLILSGILRGQVKEVREILRSYPLREYDILHQEEWACIIATRLVNEKSSQLCYDPERTK